MWTELSKIDFGDKMLWFSIMRRAIFDYVLYKGSGKHQLQWQRAYQFLFEPHTKTEAGLSFDETCALFRVEPDYVRRLINKLKRPDLKKIETTKYREDFTDEDSMRFFVEVLYWDSAKVAVPFFPPYNYSKLIREKLRLRSLPRQERQVSMPRPGVAWAAAQ
jgi:hypothetical protein